MPDSPTSLDMDSTTETPPPDLRELTPEEVEGIIAAEIKDSVTYFDTEVAQEQQKANDYFHGRPFGNEVKGRSKVILNDVRDTVLWVMPTLMRMFFGTRNVVHYRPRSADDEEYARQLTEYAQYAGRSGTSGFQAHYDWFMDALLQKIGAVIVRWDDKVRKDLERYDNLTEEQFDALVADEDVEIAGFEEKLKTIDPPDDPETGQPQIDPETGQPLPPVETSEFEVHIRRLKPQARLVVEGIPQDEFLIAGRARKLDDDCPFVGRRVKMTFSDLRSMGLTPTQIEELPTDGGPKSTRESTTEPKDETDKVHRQDWASRDIWVTECWIRVDEDGDGYSELRRILAAGDSKVKIIEDDEVAFIPIATLCPIPVPHQFYGFSLADLIMDLMILRSTLLRQMMDNIYNTNNLRYEVVDGEVELDDLLDSAPGGGVRVSAPGMVKVLEQPQLGAGSWHLLEYLHDVKETRTGVNRATQGQGSGTGDTATGTTALLDQANQRIEMIARIYAETGVTREFELFPRVMAEADVKDQVIRLRDEWVDIEGDAFKADVDVEVEVGLGTQQSAGRVDNMMLLHDLQKQLMDLDGRMVTPDNIFNAIERIPEAMGFAASELFFTKPNPDEPIPPKDPDPKVLEVEAKKEAAAFQMQIDRETLNFRREQMMVEATLKREEMKTRVQVAAIQSKATWAQAKLTSESNIATALTKQESDLAGAVVRTSARPAPTTQ